MRKVSLLGALAVLAMAGSWLLAQKSITATGEVIDTSCHIKMGAAREKHRDCAIKCAQGGIPLSVLEEKTNKVYVPGSVESSSGAGPS